MATYTLAELRNNIKRRIRQARAITDPASETEEGNIASDQAIMDALNSGRKKVVVTVRNAELWGRAEAKFQTSVNEQEYSLGEGVLQIIGVQYDVTSAGKRQADTKDAVDVKTRKMEEAVIRYPSDQPSATNPKYRITNKGIRLIVSTDGTVTADKYIRVEYIKELTDLSADDDNSDLSATLDEMVVNYALYILCAYELPSLAMASIKEFQQQAYQMNMDERLKGGN